MELHVCRNCEMINQVIGNQTQKFAILSEENLILHNLLIKARQSLRELSEKLLKSRKALVDEREHNLQMYLKQRFNGSKSIEIESMNDQNTIKPTTRSINLTESAQYTNLLKTIEEIKQKQQTSLDIVHGESDRHSALLNEHISQAEDHVSVILEFNKFLREDLFIQKKQNNIDREDFLKTVDTLAAANEKYIQEVKHSVISTVSKTADKMTRQAINSMNHQLNERDKLVATLRRQQTVLQGQIEQLQKREKLLKAEHQIVINKLKLRIKYEQEKQTALEQQRKFHAEGFYNDIKHIRQELKALNSKLQKLPQSMELQRQSKALLEATDSVSDTLVNRYTTSKLSILKV